MKNNKYGETDTQRTRYNALNETLHDSDFALSASDDEAAAYLETVADETGLAPPLPDEEMPVIEGEAIQSKSKSITSLLKRYTTGEKLGVGAEGAVFALKDANLDRTVAVKLLGKKQSSNPKKIKKFIYEALLTGRLDHPNIPPIYDLECTDAHQFYYTMKKIDGKPLSSLVLSGADTKKEVALAELIAIFIKVAEAVAYAHSCGIIHRDIKPDNIMLGSFGEVRLVDWGIAVDSSSADTHKGHLAGTPLYMSPEQARREIVCKSSDIYCLGATLFHLLFKRPPVIPKKTDEFWAQKKKGDIDQPTAHELKNIPAPLVAICLKCINAHPEERYKSAVSFSEDLKQFQLGGEVGAHSYSLIEWFMCWAKQNKTKQI